MIGTPLGPDVESESDRGSRLLRRFRRFPVVLTASWGESEVWKRSLSATGMAFAVIRRRKTHGRSGTERVRTIAALLEAVDGGVNRELSPADAQVDVAV